MSSKREGCTCEKCQECCRREPGWFVPDEVPIAARFMNVSEADFISRFCEGHVEGDMRAISPARKHGRTECIFLNQEGLCEIHTVKPYECKKVFGCQGPSRHRRMRELIKRAWK